MFGMVNAELFMALNEAGPFLAEATPRTNPSDF